ncbi:bile acid:sodium symporter [Microvirga lotononidis]|uniref:Uncharacterized protein n=1 Tax=Microvirga lotononidis TaxID=864069 RepID=I4Z0Q8_9HYPH|nr:bile acid:sodium symporter [Microvirga lotononidis]EIM29800.1 hypothetical protein MicloDRAFT_00011200 [Microvirga lotononidis]WQO31109.1 bile acid:sodium symporter [Microvirga lotononidis]
MMRKIDPFLLLIMAAVAVASVFPAQGEGAHMLDTLGILGIALLFFVHGAALPREVVIEGLVQWRLHLFIFAITFVVFPVAVLPFGVLPCPVADGCRRRSRPLPWPPRFASPSSQWRRRLKPPPTRKPLRRLSPGARAFQLANCYFSLVFS